MHLSEERVLCCHRQGAQVKTLDHLGLSRGNTRRGQEVQVRGHREERGVRQADLHQPGQ